MPEELEFLIKLSFVVVGVGGILYSLYSTLMAKAATSWIPVSGSITSHWIDENTNDGDYIYEPKVEYIYEYRGRKYIGKRIAFGLSPWNIKWLVQGAYNEATSRAPALTVFVNPRHPKVSSALTGIRSFHVGNIIFFSVWSVIVYKVLTSESI